MSISIYPKEHAFRNDQAALFLLEHFRNEQVDLELSDAIIFCNFPFFREENEVLSVKFAVISPMHGVILISTPDNENKSALESITKELDSTFSQVFSRLVKYPKLRVGKTNLAFNLDSFLFLAEQDNKINPSSPDIVIGLPSISSRLNQNKLQNRISDVVFNELTSVLDGSKALIRVPERDLDNFKPQSKVVRIAALEEEIRKFDRDQRVAYMTEIYGTQ